MQPPVSQCRLKFFPKSGQPLSKKFCKIWRTTPIGTVASAITAAPGLRFATHWLRRHHGGLSLNASADGEWAAHYNAPAAREARSRTQSCDNGRRSAFLWFGLGQGLVVVIVALFLRAPAPTEVMAASSAPAVGQTRRDYGPTEVLKSPAFWVMYVMFVMVGTGGLMAQNSQRPHTTVLRLGLGSDWSREHHVYCLPARRHRYLRPPAECN
jgi:hypothetical protein